MACENVETPDRAEFMNKNFKEIMSIATPILF